MPNTPLDSDSTDVLLFLLDAATSSDRTRAKIRDRCQLSTPRQAEELLRRLSELGLITKVSDYYNLTNAGKDEAKKLKQAHSAPRGDQTHVHVAGAVMNSTLTVTGISENPVANTAKAPPDAPPTQQFRLDPLATPLDYSEVTGMKPMSPVLMDKDGDPTLDLSDRPIPPYTIHPLRFTDTSFQQNERLKNEPEMVVRYVLTFEEYPAALPLPVVDRDSMGRSRANDMWVRYDGCISGEHCRFHIKKTKGVHELYIEDLKSKNGTFVDGQRIVPGKQVLLKHGTRLRIGRTAMIVTQIAEPLPLLSEALKKTATATPQPKATEKPAPKTTASGSATLK